MSHNFCIAPMMDRTDRHCRYFHRLLTKKSFLYTEMLHVNAVLKGNTDKLLKYHADEHPLACLLYTSPSPRDRTRSRMPSSA